MVNVLEEIKNSATQKLPEYAQAFQNLAATQRKHCLNQVQEQLKNPGDQLSQSLEKMVSGQDLVSLLNHLSKADCISLGEAIERYQDTLLPDTQKKHPSPIKRLDEGSFESMELLDFDTAETGFDLIALGDAPEAPDETESVDPESEKQALGVFFNAVVSHFFIHHVQA